jgi:signal transduction histidine kinase
MMQKADIIRAGSQLAQQIDDPDFEDILEQACFSHRMSALVYDAQKNVALSVDMLGRSSMFNQRDKRPDSSRPDNSWPMPTNPVLEGQQKRIRRNYLQRVFSQFRACIRVAVTTGAGERRVILLTTWLQPVWSMSSILKSQLGVITMVLIALALTLSVNVARRLTRPIENITVKAQKLAKGDYTADFSGDGIEELDRLAQTLNFSAKGLSRVEELRRELVANVSHDLKTPLTMIRAYAEMLRDITGENVAKRNEQLGVIISETERLSSLVNDLIHVSKNEEQTHEYKAENLSLFVLLGDVTHRFSQLYKDYSITLSCPQDAWSLRTARRRAGALN